MITLQFLITSLIVVLIPGTGAVFTIATGIARGRRAAVFSALGCTLGILPHLLATVLGLAAVMHASALAFEVLKIAGVLYLLYLAVMTWRDRSAFAVDDSSAPAGSHLRIVARAILMNILNPKLTIFFLAFLPQFVRPGAALAPMAQLLLLSGVFMAMTFAVFVCYGLAAHAFRRAVVESPRVQNWMRRGFAASFAGLGVNLAMSDR
jgi:threonine/homoserine/homoserine lactone efflux protein